LKLQKSQDNLIGGELVKGVSGGEKRRLNIAFELSKSPKLVFLDEPTSGLDSFTSFLIVKLLREIARERNMIVLYSIH
jgi:ATP-binding cassette subfamily G (WHITE) protein 2